jgi:hypothetical protein
MKNVFLMVRNGAFAVAIAVALSFGAAEALSGTAHQSLANVCTYPDYCPDDEFCEGLCYDRGHVTGVCVPGKDCCSCMD